jgi:hypothetical protein
MTLGPGARRRLVPLLGAMLGEPEGIATDVAAFFADYLRRAPLPAAAGLRVMVWSLTWSPLLVEGRPLPAGALSPEMRERHLARWARSRSYLLREGFFLVKTVALLGWGAHPDVRARFGMPPAAAPRETPAAPAPWQAA